MHCQTWNKFYIILNSSLVFTLGLFYILFTEIENRLNPGPYVNDNSKGKFEFLSQGLDKMHVCL